MLSETGIGRFFCRKERNKSVELPYSEVRLKFIIYLLIIEIAFSACGQVRPQVNNDQVVQDHHGERIALTATPFFDDKTKAMSIPTLTPTTEPTPTNTTENRFEKLFADNVFFQILQEEGPVNPEEFQIPTDQASVIGESNLSLEEINQILKETPMHDQGELISYLSERTGIKAEFILAVVMVETNFGRDQSSIAYSGADFNYANLRCSNAGDYENSQACATTPSSEWQKYETVEEFLIKLYFLLRIKYIIANSNLPAPFNNSMVTVQQIIPIYAPPFENNTNKYIERVIAFMKG